jgi:hypothetical protein
LRNFLDREKITSHLWLPADSCNSVANFPPGVAADGSAGSTLPGWWMCNMKLSERQASARRSTKLDVIPMRCSLHQDKQCLRRAGHAIFGNPSEEFKRKSCIALRNSDSLFATPIAAHRPTCDNGPALPSSLSPLGTRSEVDADSEQAGGLTELVSSVKPGRKAGDGSILAGGWNRIDPEPAFSRAPPPQ